MEATIEKEGQTAVIHANYLLAAGNLYMVTYKIYPTGVVNVNAHFTSVSMEATPDEISEATKSATFSPKSQAAREAAAKLEVPRIGVRFRLPADMQQVQYFGRGPEENYLDRQAGTIVGLYTTTAEKCTIRMYVPRKTDIIQIPGG